MAFAGPAVWAALRTLRSGSFILGDGGVDVGPTAFKDRCCPTPKQLPSQTLAIKGLKE